MNHIRFYPALRLSGITMLIALFSTVSSCASIPSSRPLAPSVSIESITPVKLGLTKQEIAFDLKISNPNDFDLPLQALNFIASVEDSEIAQGASNEKVTIPANGDAMLEVLVNTRISKLLGKILLSKSARADNMAYDVQGFVKLSNWPARIPFNVDGTVDTPTLQ